MATDGGVARALIDEPRTRNALSIAMIDRLASDVRDASRTTGVRAIVLAGTGGVFSSGANLKESPTPDESIRAVAGLYDAIADAPQPVIARVEGYCLGLAVGVAATCDLVVTTPDTRFGLPEPRFGQAPTLAALPLAARVRRGDLSRLLLTAAAFDGTHAHEIGLADAVASAEDLDAYVDGWTRDIRESDATALSAGKQLARSLPQLTPDAARAFAEQLTVRLGGLESSPAP